MKMDELRKSCTLHGIHIVIFPDNKSKLISMTTFIDLIVKAAKKEAMVEMRKAYHLISKEEMRQDHLTLNTRELWMQSAGSNPNIEKAYDLYVEVADGSNMKAKEHLCYALRNLYKALNVTTGEAARAVALHRLNTLEEQIRGN